VTIFKRKEMNAETLKLSVIIAVHDQAELLEQNLPKFFTQEGEVAYEVIVVDDSSTDDTPDVLKRMKAEYPNLYTTFLPQSKVPNPSRRRLALTIGAKAAHHSWIVMADISRPPLSDTWFSDLVSNISSSSEVVMSYGDKRTTIQSFDSLDEASPLIRKAERTSGKGHRGRFFAFRRGLYHTTAFKKEQIHDAIKLYDLKIKGSQLAGLRLKVVWKNLFE